MTDERHSYTRFTFKPDGSQHVETVILSGDDICFKHSMGRGDRTAALELVNRWNRLGAVQGDSTAPRYIYVLNAPYPTKE